LPKSLGLPGRRKNASSFGGSSKGDSCLVGYPDQTEVLAFDEFGDCAGLEL
jgi:hypothetical protein